MLDIRDMKTQKTLWQIFPRHFWTGILGGGIWVIWLVAALFLQRRWHIHYYDENFLLTWFISYILFTPLELSGFFSDILINRALENGGSVYTVPYRYVGYTILFVIFVILGIVVGKKANDSEQEVRRRRVLKISFGIVIFLWACRACTLPILFAFVDE